MGFSSWAHWLVILVVVVLIFGTTKLRNVGKDLGGAVHDFKKGLNEGSEADKTAAAEQPARNEEDAGKSG